MAKNKIKQKKKTRQPGILYLAKLSFKTVGEINTFHILKLREFTNRPALQEILKGVLQGEMKGH